MNNAIKPLSEVLNLLQVAGVRVADEIEHDLMEHLNLVREWSKYASLVSQSDAGDGLVKHCVDSLCLLPAIDDFLEGRTGEYIDLGSGGGFPAIPICAAMPGLKATLIERNTKKTTFLRKVTARLKLENVDIDNSSFEGLSDTSTPRIITSRAIEKPEKVLPVILEALSPNDLYLCQSASIRSLRDEDLHGFEVDAVSDDNPWSAFRRSTLYLVRRSE